VEHEKLLEALEIDYRLRSTFFYRKLHELGFTAFNTEIDKLIQIANNFNWDSRENWNISTAAWQAISHAGIAPLAVFAHPRVLQEQPRLSAYYRNVAALPQKAVNKLAFGIVPVEAGTTPLTPERALSLCRLYNSHISLIVESAADYSREDAIAMMLASAGAQINGSWLNAVGEEAELVTRKILIRSLLQANYLVSAILKSKSTSIELDNLVDQAHLLSGIRLKNQTSILFSSEPDLSLLNAAGELVAAIEVKGGKDTAGALERYGAAKKSFEEARRQNPRVVTIFLASCMTDEVEKRLAKDDLIDYTFNLTEVVTNEAQRQAFVRFVLGLLDVDFER